MKRISTLIIAGMITLFFLITGVNAADTESATMLTTTKMIGATVRNLQGEVLGSITELERDSESGDISFAILSHGEKLIPVPINALTFLDDGSATLDITKEMLASAPSFEKDKMPDMLDRNFSDAVHRYYGIRPAWEERSVGDEKKKLWNPYPREMKKVYR